MLAIDKVMHLKLGVPMAFLLVSIVLIAKNIGAGYAVAFGAVALGVGVEVYQKIRKEGTPDFWDALASAAAGLVLGLGFELWKFVN